MRDVGLIDDMSAKSCMALFDFAFENAPIGIALVDTSAKIIKGNAAFAKMIDRPLNTIAGTAFADFTHPDDIEADLQLFRSVLNGDRDGYSIEKRYLQPNSEIVFVRIHVAAMRDKKGDVIRFITQIEDIAHLKAHERELEERSAKLELALDALPGGFWHMDVASGHFETSQQLAEHISGKGAVRLDLQAYLAKIRPSDLAAADLSKLVAGRIDDDVAQYRLATIRGERWIRCSRRLLRSPDGSPMKVVGVAIDFTDDQIRIEQHRTDAETDPLTGLLNRRGLEARWREYGGTAGTLLAIDLDGFKAVNDKHGHHVGDQVLQSAARCLIASTRGHDLVSRLGGDEFLILVAGEKGAAEAVAERIVRAFRANSTFSSTETPVRASIGGASISPPEPLAQTLARADRLLYQQKHAGKDGWTLEG